MAFIGKKINVSEIAAIGAVAFLIGRMQVFDGTFPAATAFLAMMLSVSTVYIYLLPVLSAGILTHAGTGVFFYGDLLALGVVGVFFLFFHRRDFSVQQRTLVGIGAIIICNFAAYGFADMMFVLQPADMLKELIAFCLYIQVFHGLITIIYRREHTSALRFSKERIAIALVIFAVSLIGSIGVYEVVFPLWMLAAAILLYGKSLQAAVVFWAMAAVYALCQGEIVWDGYIWVLAALLAAWYGAAQLDRRHGKVLIALVLFCAAIKLGGSIIYSCAAAMAFFIWLPPTVILHAATKLDQTMDTETDTDTEKDLRLLHFRKDLMRKRDAFVSLGRLYGKEVEGKQIVSYQFMGMARTIDRLMDQFQSKAAPDQGQPLVKVTVGQASYSFDAISGDSVAAFPFDEDYLALVISDGMGKGSRAAEESIMVVKTLSRLLQAGFDVDLAMKTVNGILMTGNQEERFATVDLAIIDRKRSRAKIYKMGAATTFIKHDGRVSMLKRQALPAGITSGLELEYIDVRLQKGDVLVMVSDGVTDCDKRDYNCDWLRNRLVEMGSRDPETIAELVVNKAAEKYGIHERDDLTVVTAAIGV